MADSTTLRRRCSTAGGDGSRRYIRLPASVCLDAAGSQIREDKGVHGPGCGKRLGIMNQQLLHLLSFLRCSTRGQ